jgi:PAS domain S-box-containing protein
VGLLGRFVARKFLRSRRFAHELRHSLPLRRPAERDAVFVCLCAVAVYVVVGQTQLDISFFYFVADHPEYEIGTLLVGALTLAVGAVFFAARRWRELRREIHTRRLAEDNAERAAGLLRDALDSVSEGFVIYDRSDRLVFTNDTYRRLFPNRTRLMRAGVQFEDLLRQLVAEGEFPEAAGQEDEWIAQRVQQHHGSNAGIERRLADGRWLLVSERRMRNGGITGLRIDITEQKLAQESLRQSESRLRDFVELASDWLWEQDTDLRFTWGSGIPTLQELTSVSFIGRTRWEFADPASETEIQQWASHKADLEARRAFQNFHYRLTGTNGRVRHLSSSGKPLFDASGAFVGYRGTGNDITERVEAEQALRKSRDMAEAASRAKSEFLATMSHELRTPLHAIIGFSELIANQKSGAFSPKYAEYANDIRESGIHLLDLVNNVLDVSMLDADRYKIREERVSVAEIVVSTTKMLDTTMQQKRARLVWESCVDGVVLWADRRALKQVLLNLFNNAVKFTEPGGVVSIGAKSLPDGNLEMTVMDTGTGVERAYLEHVFEPFYQVDATSSRRHQGAGLGLSICRKLLALHGGTIELTSEVGRGTAVIMVFPSNRVVRRGDLVDRI